jgi:hypothetical protein
VYNGTGISDLHAQPMAEILHMDHNFYDLAETNLCCQPNEKTSE